MTIITTDSGRIIGVSSWTTGFTHVQRPQKSLREEACQNLLAVINRLLLQGREEEAEELFDEFA